MQQSPPSLPLNPPPRGCFLSDLGGGDAGRLCSQVLLTPHKGNTLTKCDPSRLLKPPRLHCAV